MVEFVPQRLKLGNNLAVSSLSPGLYLQPDNNDSIDVLCNHICLFKKLKLGSIFY